MHSKFPVRKLTDSMSPEKIEAAKARHAKRMSKNKGSDIDPETFFYTEFGYYFGWEGLMAIKLGYIEKRKLDGQIVRVPFDLEEAIILLEGVRKVDRSKTAELANAIRGVV